LLASLEGCDVVGRGVVGSGDGLEERLSVIRDAAVFHPMVMAIGVKDHVTRS
jgi:hypothetical protein